jgi:hypothetical protein
MKAGTISLGLWHIEPGHHREVCQWHDVDHKPEVLGTTPNVFISQRWVAPPAMVAARSRSRLQFGGGEYVNLYWTTGTPEQLGKDFRELGARMTELGRMEPNKYIHTTWRTSTRPASLQARAGQVLSAEAVPASPVNSGMMLMVVEVQAGPRRDDYVRWLQTERVPMMLETGLFNGEVEVAGADPDRENHVAALFYTDVDDPTAAYLEVHKIFADWNKNGHGFPEADQVRTVLHSSMYTNSIGRYEFYD